MSRIMKYIYTFLIIIGLSGAAFTETKFSLLCDLYSSQDSNKKFHSKSDGYIFTGMQNKVFTVSHKNGGYSLKTDIYIWESAVLTFEETEGTYFLTVVDDAVVNSVEIDRYSGKLIHIRKFHNQDKFEAYRWECRKNNKKF